MCSTPFGIIEGNTKPCKRRKTCWSGAQRLSASSKETLRGGSVPVTQMCAAPRRSASSKQTPPYGCRHCAAKRVCSTPFGIIEGNTSKQLSSRQNPVLNAFRHHQRKHHRRPA